MFDNIDESIIEATIKSFNQYDNTFRETCNNFIQAGLEDLIATDSDEKNGENVQTTQTL